MNLIEWPNLHVYLFLLVRLGWLGWLVLLSERLGNSKVRTWKRGYELAHSFWGRGPKMSEGGTYQLDQLLLLDQQNHYYNNPLLLDKLQPADRAFLSKAWHVKGPYKLLTFHPAHTRKSGLSQASYLTRHIDLYHFGN